MLAVEPFYDLHQLHRRFLVHPRLFGRAPIFSVQALQCLVLASTFFPEDTVEAAEAFVYIAFCGGIHSVRLGRKM